jgi:hypothetical protein
VDVGPQPHLDEIHHLHLAPHIRLDLALREAICGNQLLPALLITCRRDLRPQPRQIGPHLFARGREVVRVGHLDFQQLAVDQALQSTDPVRFGDPAQWFLLHERFKADGVIPVALQHRFVIDRGNHAVDHLSGQGRDWYQQQAANRDVYKSSHQNVCPILKKKLKRRSVCTVSSSRTG